MFNRIFEYNAVSQKRMAADYLNFKMSLLWFRVTQSRTMRTPAPGFYSAIVPPICKTNTIGWRKRILCCRPGELLPLSIVLKQFLY